MKVLVLSTSYPRDKRDSRVAFVRAFIKELTKEPDMNVKIVTSSAPDSKKLYQVMDKAKIYRFDYFWPRKSQKLTYTDSGGMLESYRNSFIAKIQIPFFMLNFFLRSLRSAKWCDVIHAQWLFSGLIGVFLKKIYNKPLICEVRGGGIRSMPTWLRKYIIKRVDYFISWTPELTDILKSLGRTKDVYDIKGMIDFEKLDTKEGTNEFKKEFNIRNEFNVLFLGRLCYMKNPLGFIKAIPYVKDRNIRFFMVGDGEYREKASNLIQKLKIDKKITMTGARSDVNAILRNTSVFVSLSPIAHTFSATIMEAMYLGVPVILDQPPYTKKYLGDNTLLVPNNNPKALASAIGKIKNNTKLRNRLSKNGRSFVKQLGFDKKIIIQKTVKLYKKALKEI